MIHFTRRLMRPLPLLLIGVILIVGYRAAGMVRSALVLRTEARAAEEKIRALTERKKELEAAITELQTPQAAEREAKERFNLKKIGEQVVVVPPEEKKSTTTPLAPMSFWDRMRAIFQSR